MSDTRFEEYEKKTRVIILIIGFIAFLSFIFGLVILSIEEAPYNPETSNPTYTSDESSVPDDYMHEQVPIIQGDNELLNENQKAITLTPAEINMRQFILNVDVRNQNILTIGTNGTDSIFIEKVELVKVDFSDDDSDGFDIREKACQNVTLRGAEHCEVEIYWSPSFPGNVQNNIKVTWYETRLGPSNAKSEFVSIRGNATYKDDSTKCAPGENCISNASGNLAGHRLAIGPNGEIIGYIDENGLVYDANGNHIGRVNEEGLIVDKDGNIIGVAQNLRLAYDKDGNLIG